MRCCVAGESVKRLLFLTVEQPSTHSIKYALSLFLAVTRRRAHKNTHARARAPEPEKTKTIDINMTTYVRFEEDTIGGDIKITQ